MEGPHDLAECWVLAKYLNLLDNHQVVKVKKHHVAKLIHERKHAEHYFCVKYRELPGTANALCYIELYRISGTCQYKIILCVPLHSDVRITQTHQSLRKQINSTKEGWTFTTLLFQLPPKFIITHTNHKSHPAILPIDSGIFDNLIGLFWICWGSSDL